MKFFLYSRGGKDATLALGDMAASMKSYKINESVEEARQMKDPKKDVMVVKKGKVIVIDKGKEKEYLKRVGNSQKNHSMRRTYQLIPHSKQSLRRRQSEI